MLAVITAAAYAAASLGSPADVLRVCAASTLVPPLPLRWGIAAAAIAAVGLFAAPAAWLLPYEAFAFASAALFLLLQLTGLVRTAYRANDAIGDQGLCAMHVFILASAVVTAASVNICIYLGLTHPDRAWYAWCVLGAAAAYISVSLAVPRGAVVPTTVILAYSTAVLQAALQPATNGAFWIVLAVLWTGLGIERQAASRPRQAAAVRVLGIGFVAMTLTDWSSPLAHMATALAAPFVYLWFLVRREGAYLEVPPLEEVEVDGSGDAKS